MATNDSLDSKNMLKMFLEACLDNISGSNLSKGMTKASLT